MFSDRDDTGPGPDPAAVLPAVRARAAELVRARRSRHRLVGAATVLGVTGAVVATVVALTLPGPAVGPAVSTPPPVDRGAPLQDGDRVGASGQVVSVPGRPVRFCTPLPVAGVGRPPGYVEPAPGYCDYGVDVTGVDLQALQGRREVDGAVEGSAALQGVLRDGVLVVDRQGPPVVPDRAHESFDEPPCPEPAGGWATPKEPNSDTSTVDAYRAAHPGAIPFIALARPSAREVVIVALTSGDPAPVRAALASSLGPDQLCVTESAFSTADITSVAQDPALDVVVATGIYGRGDSRGADGQFVVVGDATMITPAIAAAVARHPAGLVQILPWLQRVP